MYNIVCVPGLTIKLQNWYFLYFFVFKVYMISAVSVSAWVFSILILLITVSLGWMIWVGWFFFGKETMFKHWWIHNLYSCDIIIIIIIIIVWQLIYHNWVKWSISMFYSMWYTAYLQVFNIENEFKLAGTCTSVAIQLKRIWVSVHTWLIQWMEFNLIVFSFLILR